MLFVRSLLVFNLPQENDPVSRVGKMVSISFSFSWDEQRVGLIPCAVFFLVVTLYRGDFIAVSLPQGNNLEEMRKI